MKTIHTVVVAIILMLLIVIVSRAAIVADDQPTTVLAPVVRHNSIRANPVSRQHGTAECSTTTPIASPILVVWRDKNTGKMKSCALKDYRP
jgi:hypothetical protein